MSIDFQSHRDYRFAFGVLAGTAIGAGMMLLFGPAPRTKVRHQTTGAVDHVARAAQQAGDRRGIANMTVIGAPDQRFASKPTAVEPAVSPL